MKKLIYVIFALICPSVWAQQNIVYKCVEANGIISYINISVLTKNNNCQKTDLADLDKGKMVIRGDHTEKSVVASGATMVKNDEQKKRDEGRMSILGKELQEEKEQLTSVEKMLKNVDPNKDIEQRDKLKEMQVRHTKNIVALKKELGIKEDSN